MSKGELNDARQTEFDAIVIGAGFAGLYMLHKLRALGMTARVFEMGGDVGGTWYWNRYPGARCDVESLAYSFSFSPELEQEWEWTERYAPQPEILRYLCHVADRLDLRRDISFNTRVTAATYHSNSNRWTVDTDGGGSARARFLITAVGCHSAHNLPKIPGLEKFRGLTLHTANWTHDAVDFSNKRVGVIGTGSSGIQTITQVAKEAGQLTVFQRTPNFSLPANNSRLEPEKVAEIKRNYASIRDLAKRGLISGAGDMLMSEKERESKSRRAFDVSEEERNALFEARWASGGVILLSSFADITTDDKANHAASDFIRGKIRSIVKDPAVAEKLCPKDYPVGAKRICVDTGYYATFNRPNVSLVDIREDPVAEVTENGVRLASGKHFDLDILILATGFDAVTGSLIRLNITGEKGLRLADYWADGPLTYLGIGIAGFPNLFTITGPLSPSALSNMVVSIEQHVDWIGDCLAHMRKNGFDRIAVDAQAEKEWQKHVLDTAEGAVQTKAKSWYVGANIPGKPRTILVYTGGVGRYREICDDVSAANYRGFLLSKAENS